MGNALIFTLCSSLFLLAGYLSYKCLLAGCKQPKINRWTIMSIYTLAALWFIFPEIKLELPSIETISSGTEIGTANVNLTREGEIPQSIPWHNIGIWIWIAGMAFFLSKTLFGTFSLVRFIHKGKNISRNGYTLIVTDDAPHSPFSWMHYIVINKTDLGDEDMIISHELAHIRRHHAFDLMVAQLFCTIQWFNPGAWLMKDELKNVMEYQADEDVIRGGANIEDYQLILIKKAVGNRFHQLTNSLNHSQLKKRLTMMMKSKSSWSARLGVAALLPAMLVAAAVVNLPSVASAMDSLRPHKDSGFNPETQTAKVKETPKKDFQILAQTQPKETRQAVATNKISARNKARNSTASAICKTDDKSQITVTQRMSTDDNIDVLPKYPGGELALINYIYKNVTYPPEAVAKGIDGNVIVTFVVETDGSISNVRVSKPVNPALDAEAIRVVKSLPKKFIPAKKDGKAVNVDYNLPIKFKLKQ